MKTASDTSWKLNAPILCQGKPLVDFARKTSFVQYLHFVNDTLALRQSRAYFTQVQLLMYIANLSSAVLFVYSRPSEPTADNYYVHVSVPRDDSFLSAVVPKLESFYF